MVHFLCLSKRLSSLSCLLFRMKVQKNEKIIFFNCPAVKLMDGCTNMKQPENYTRELHFYQGAARKRCCSPLKKMIVHKEINIVVPAWGLNES